MQVARSWTLHKWVSQGCLLNTGFTVNSFSCVHCSMQLNLLKETLESLSEWSRVDVHETWVCFVTIRYCSFVMLVLKLTAASKCTVQGTCTLIILCLCMHLQLLNHTVTWFLSSALKHMYTYVHCNSLWQSLPLQYCVTGKRSCYRLTVLNWIIIKNNIHTSGQKAKANIPATTSKRTMIIMANIYWKATKKNYT